MDASKRVDTLYMDSEHEVKYFGQPYSTSPARMACLYVSPSASMPRESHSGASTSSSSSTGGYETVFGRRASIASSVSSVEPMAIWDTQNQNTPNLAASHGYNLPCQFGFLGCNEQFHPSDIEPWIAHSSSHFHLFSPPPKSICSFCDVEFETDGNDRARQWKWRERMYHIAGHIMRRGSAHGMKPDYFVLDYLRDIGVLKQDDYEYQVSYTERPYCDGLLPLGSSIPGSRTSSKTNDIRDDLEAERRLLRREKDKDKGKRRESQTSSRGHSHNHRHRNSSPNRRR